MLSAPLVFHVLTAAIRDRLVVSVFISLIVATCLSIFMGSIALIEQDQFVIVFMSSGLRLAVIFGLVLFIIFFIRRSFDAKDIDFLLSRPVSRLSFIASYAAGFLIISMAMSLLAGLFVASFALQLNAPSLDGYVLWVLSFVFEAMAISLSAFFFAMILSSAVSATMACIGLYVLARMIGQILGIMKTVVDIPGEQILKALMQGVSILVPRFDLMAQSSWLLYGAEDASHMMISAFVQIAIFMALIFTATSLDLVRRQF
jgi:hypothetical protein